MTKAQAIAWAFFSPLSQRGLAGKPAARQPYLAALKAEYEAIRLR